jgi:hypothetical protein
VENSFLAKGRSTFVELVNSLKRRLTGRPTKRDEEELQTEVDQMNKTDSLRFPDLALSAGVQHALQSAVMKAKLLFDTYQWEWATPHTIGGYHVPSAKEIEETYRRLIDDTWAQAIEVVDGETTNSGNAETGRLRVEYLDDAWTFSIMLTQVVDGGDEGVEEIDEGHWPRHRPLANAKQLAS